MKKLIIVLSLLIFAANINYPQNEVKLKITQSSVNTLLQAFCEAKYFSYGKFVPSGPINYYSFKIKTAALSVYPDNNFSVTMTFDAVANIDIGISNFDYTLNNSSITLNGIVELKALQDDNGNEIGYKIAFKPTITSYTPQNWLTEIIGNAFNGINAMLPEISTTDNIPLLPDIFSPFFTSGVPQLSTDYGIVTLSLSLKEGPRFYQVYNDVDQRKDIGTVEHEENSTYVNYPSPTVFEWEKNSSHKIQTPSELLDGTVDKFKYKNWINRDNILNEIAPRRIQLTVGNSDEEYLAKFEQAKRVQLSNSLEGIFSGGVVHYDSYVVPAFDDYDFFHPTQTHQINTLVPNGTLGYNWHFQQWSDGNTSPQRSIIINSDKNLVANYKGTQLSNQTDAYENNSQRKFVRLRNTNYLLSIYNSSNKVWIEQSNDNGANWFLKNGGIPFDGDIINEYSSPAIDYIPWNETHPFAAVVYNALKLSIIRENSTVPYYSYNFNVLWQNNVEYVTPVVGVSQSGIFVACNGAENANGQKGLAYFYGETSFAHNNVAIQWRDGEYKIIPGTTVNSKNPTIAADKNATSHNIFHIAWEDNNQIKYCKATGIGSS